MHYTGAVTGDAVDIRTKLKIALWHYALITKNDKKILETDFNIFENRKYMIFELNILDIRFISLHAQFDYRKKLHLHSRLTTLSSIF